MPKDRVPRGGRGGGKTRQERINELSTELQNLETGDHDEQSENY